MSEENKLITLLFATKFKKRPEKIVKLRTKPMTACLVSDGIKQLEAYQPELIEYELNGRFLSARSHPNSKAFYPFNPLELRLQIKQSKQGPMSIASIHFYNGTLDERHLTLESINSLKLETGIPQTVSDMLFRDRMDLDFNQRNGIFRVNIGPAVLFIGYSEYFDQALVFDKFDKLVIFNMLSDFLRCKGTKPYLNLKNIRPLFLKLKLHLGQLTEAVAAYRKLIDKVELEKHLDEGFLPTFALITRAYNNYLIIPVMAYEAEKVADPQKRIFHRLYSLLSCVSEVNKFADLKNETMMRILEKQSEGLEEEMMSLLDVLHWEEVNSLISKKLIPLQSTPLFHEIEIQILAKLNRHMPSWQQFAGLLVKHHGSMAGLFPNLHSSEHSEVMFDLLTMAEGHINPPVPSRFRVDSSGVAAFISSYGDWWVDSEFGQLLDKYERVHAKVTKTVKYAEYVWTKMNYEGKELVQKYCLSDDPDIGLEYIRDEISEEAFKGAIPDFGNSKYIYYVRDGQICCFPNERELSLFDMKSISLNKLLRDSIHEEENVKILKNIDKINESAYDAHYYLSKRRLLIRCIEGKSTRDDKKINDVIFSFKYSGGKKFIYQSKHKRLVPKDIYNSKNQATLGKFKFFSRRKVDYCLAYSTLTGEFSLGCYQDDSYVTVLKWGVHCPASFKYGNSPSSLKIEWQRKKNREKNIYFCMDWDQFTEELRVAACWVKGPNPHLLVPHLTLFSLNID